MKRLRLDYDHEVEIDCLVSLEIGKLQCWFALCDDADWLVAFTDDVGETFICQPSEDRPIQAELIRTVPGFRLSRQYPLEEFVQKWHKASDPYLYPKRMGKLKQDWPGLAPDVPLGILADWLQDHGCDKAAEILRNHKE